VFVLGIEAKNAIKMLMAWNQMPAATHGVFELPGKM